MRKRARGGGGKHRGKGWEGVFQKVHIGAEGESHKWGKKLYITENRES